jgi:DNA-directed RNA polymerase specialized sigma subunit
MKTVITELTKPHVEQILLYHSSHGFDKDLIDIKERIKDFGEMKSELTSLNFCLAVPANKKNVSSVEICVMHNLTLSALEFQAKEFERFIDKLNFIIDSLPENEKSVIKSRYFNKYNTAKEFKYVAKEVNYSEDWCEELNKKALENIRQKLNGVKITWSEV